MATNRFCLRWTADGDRVWLAEGSTWVTRRRDRAREFASRREARVYACKYPEGTTEVVRVQYPCSNEQYGDAYVLRALAHHVGRAGSQTTEGKRAVARAAKRLLRDARAISGRARLFRRRRVTP